MKGYKGVVLTLAGIVIMLIVSACATADPYAGKWVGYYEPKANVIYLATIEKKGRSYTVSMQDQHWQGIGKNRSWQTDTQPSAIGQVKNGKLYIDHTLDLLYFIVPQEADTLLYINRPGNAAIRFHREREGEIRAFKEKWRTAEEKNGTAVAGKQKQ